MILVITFTALLCSTIQGDTDADSQLKGLMLDGQGNIIYDAAGFTVLEEYPEMCGGKNADEACYECFECNDMETRCVPIAGCIPHCDVDDDCTREQICLPDEKICQLPDGPPKDNDRSGSKGSKGGKGYDDRGAGGKGRGGGPTSMLSKGGMPGLETARQASTSEILLMITLCIGLLVTLWHCYKWCIHQKLSTQFQALSEENNSTMPSHCVIDGQAFY